MGRGKQTGGIAKPPPVVSRHYPETGTVKAYPPARVEQVWKVRRGRSERTMVTLMCPRGLRPLSAARLEQAAADAGWLLSSAASQRARTKQHRDAVVALWPIKP